MWLKNLAATKLRRPGLREQNHSANRHTDIGERGVPMKTNECRKLFPFLVLVAVGGCALGPNYKRPAVDTPEEYRFATPQATNSLGELPWWEVFKDPLLKELIHTALTNNYNLKQAVARVEQARQQV